MELGNWKIYIRGWVMLTMMLTSGLLLAEKPDWAGPQNGQGKHKNKQQEDRRDTAPEYSSSRQGVDIRIGGYFGDQQRTEVNSYYREQSRTGHCPPGLAKKNNGCLPPGQARKWGIGMPLPRDVVYYPVEPGIQVRIGIPPAGHKFVRVASDILLIAVGTGMVVDAIQDLGR